MRDYATRRGWTIAMQVKEVGSGAAQRQRREELLEAAGRREIDVVVVWRLDRWGRSVTDLLATLQELEHLGVGFVSLTEALDLTTPAGRAMAALLAVFADFEREILGERVRAGFAHARQNGKRLGRPLTAGSMPARSVNYTAPASTNLKSPPPQHRSHFRASYPVRKDLIMSSSTTEFHKIWIDQCTATEDIRDQFGLHSALDYIIGEKLFSFLRAAEQDPLFAAEMPDFIGEIRWLFAAEVIHDYLDRLEKTKYLAPLDPDIEMDDLDDPNEDEPEPWLENPVMGAEELLRFARVRQLLQS
jgi:hypothetical protein